MKKFLFVQHCTYVALSKKAYSSCLMAFCAWDLKSPLLILYANVEKLEEICCQVMSIIKDTMIYLNPPSEQKFTQCPTS